MTELCTYRYPASAGKKLGNFLANFSKTADRNETTPISKQSLAQAGFNKKSFIKIGSLYNELLQSKGTVLNDQKSRVLRLQSQN